MNFFDQDRFNIKGLTSLLEQETEQTGEARIMLNFPNNPTGYSPTQKEADEIIATCIRFAQAGNKILIILDEAYHGLFFDSELIQESLFSQLVNAHENIFTVKICGATKELFVWGFRVGFITFGIKNGNSEVYQALEQKTGGLIRGGISNASTSAQSILASILKDKSYIPDFKRNFNIIKIRALEVKRILENHPEYQSFFEAYPFNSGYFMLIKLKNGIESETIRQKLLKREIGTISTAQHDLRIAFSSVEKENITHIFDEIYRITKELSEN